MEIKPVPKIIEDIGKLVQEEKYEEACSFGLENIDLNKKYIEGEYAFKNILEEYIFQFFKKGEIKRKYPLMLDYSSLYENVEWYSIQTQIGRYYTLFDRKDMKYYKAAANCFKKSLWLQDEGNPAAGYMAFLLNTGLVSDSIRDAIFVDSEPVYFRAGIECGNPLGLFDLGMLYFEGIGEKHQGRNYEKAFTCLSRSYEIMPKGYVAYVLGIMYYNGDGTKQDFNKAFKYLSEALDKGERHSLEVLSICYENGLGTEKNLAIANEMKKQAKDVEDTVDGDEIVLSYLKSMAEYCNDKNGAMSRKQDM